MMEQGSKKRTMLTTLEGVYTNGKIILNELPAGLEGAQVIVTFLPSSPPAAKPEVLYGVWRDFVPKDFDVDAALAEIRNSWEAKFDGNPE